VGTLVARGVRPRILAFGDRFVSAAAAISDGQIPLKMTYLIAAIFFFFDNWGVAAGIGALVFVFWPGPGFYCRKAFRLKRRLPGWAGMPDRVLSRNALFRWRAAGVAAFERIAKAR